MLRSPLANPAVRLGALAAACLSLAACGKPPTGSATIRGCRVEIYAYTDQDAGVEALGEKGEHLSDDQFLIRVPLDRIPAGATDVEVVARRGSSERRARFPLEVPHDGTPAGSMAGGQCVAAWQTGVTDPSASHDFKLATATGMLDLELGDHPELEIGAAPAKRLIVQGKPLELVAGSARFAPDLDDLGATVSSAALDPSVADRPAEMFLPVTVERPDGQTRAERIVVYGPALWAEKRARARLSRVAQAPLPGPPSPGAPSVVIVPDDPSEPMRLVGAPGPLSGAAFVALRKATRRPSGSCAYEGATAKAFEIDSALEVRDARTGALAGERQLRARRGRCPSIIDVREGETPEVRFEVPAAEIDAWLTTFTKR